MNREDIRKNMNFIDLFSGCGGKSLGFVKKGFNNLFAIDIDKNACATYKKNFPNHLVLNEDIINLNEQRIKSIIGKKKVDLIIGGPPCQGFSIAGSIGRNFIDDPRNHLFKEFARIVSILKPKYFIMENVARVYTHRNGNTRMEILKTFTKLGYDVDCQIINSADYGVPQVRKRIIFIGNNKCIKNIFPKIKTLKYKNVFEAISDLPKLSSGQSSEIPNHNAMNHTDKMLTKMSFIKDGGNRKQIPSNLQPKTGDIRKYIKYNSKEPSICITGDMRKVFHYNQNRALTVRELARLQSFPDDFIFCGNKISQQQQVGDAVPPLVSKALAETIIFMEKSKIVS